MGAKILKAGQGEEMKTPNNDKRLILLIPIMCWLQFIQINYEVLTWEDELLLVFEITGGCGRKEKEKISLI